MKEEVREASIGIHSAIQIVAAAHWGSPSSRKQRFHQRSTVKRAINTRSTTSTRASNSALHLAARRADNAGFSSGSGASHAKRVLQKAE